MRKRMMLAAIGTVLLAGGFAAAQEMRFTIGNSGRDPRDPSGRTMINLVLRINGVTVRADRAVASEMPGELMLEGNVRITLPASK